MALLIINALSRRFAVGPSEVRALWDVNLSIEHGEWVAVLGPSGAGKSTLIHILACLDRPTAGQYLLDNEDVFMWNDKTLSRLRNRRIGMVFQGFHLLPQLTVAENVALPFQYGQNTPDAHSRIVEVLRGVGLADRASHFPSQLSGGEMQRAAVARAIVNDPDLILADEPTGNLDPQNTSILLDQFRKLNNDGRTLVVVTHNEQVASAAGRRVLISGGKIVSDQRVCRKRSNNALS